MLVTSAVLARVEGAASRAVVSKPVPERGSKGKPGRGVQRVGPSRLLPGWKSVMRRPWKHLKGSWLRRYSTSSSNTLISPPLHTSQVEVMVCGSCEPSGRSSSTLARSSSVSTPRRTPHSCPGSR